MSYATNTYPPDAVAPTSVWSRVKLGTLNKAVVLIVDIIREVRRMRRAAHFIQPDDGQ
jgi:hypothetical protein